MNQAKIIGTGSYLPKKVLTNKHLEEMVETSDEWIVSRTGMKERRIAADGEFTSDMGLHAALIALAKAEVSPEEIDLVLVATLTPDYTFPSTACIIQAKLGAKNAAALDIQAACSGYVYALSLANALIVSGQYKNILLVASEKLSSIVNYKDRGTCILFGDGAAACVVSAFHKKPSLVIKQVSLGSDGDQTDILILPAGGCRTPASKESIEAGLHYIKMDGKETFKHAVRRMEASSKECLEKAGLKEGDISWLVPHQANIRIIEALSKRFNVPSERVFITLAKYGNTSASSLGIALDELLHEKELQKGDNLLLTAFGAGLTWGSTVVTYE